MNISPDSKVTSDTTPGSVSPDIVLPPDPILGSLRFGRYRIVRELGGRLASAGEAREILGLRKMKPRD